VDESICQECGKSITKGMFCWNYGDFMGKMLCDNCVDIWTDWLEQEEPEMKD